MNRLNRFIASAAIAVISVLTVFADFTDFPAGSPVDTYGRLFADGNRIAGEKSNGETVQLKGPSFYWSHSNWAGRHFFITDAVDAMIDGWNAQIIRFPLGINEGTRDDGGYDTDPEANWERLKLVVDHAVSRGVYVVVDWHAHNAHTPANTALAIDFFTNPELAGKYGNNPAVIFEIYNEPVGPASTWATEVKPYSEAVIGAIREKEFNNLIVVGNPFWTSLPDVAAANPPVDSDGKPFDNMAMSFHFYSHTHKLDGNHWGSSGKTYRKAVTDALDAGFPVFVSEWGTNDASDTIPHSMVNFGESDLWHAFLDSLKISSCAWSAAVVGNVLDYWNGWNNPLNLGSGVLDNWTNPNGMTPHGRYIYHWLTGKDTTVTESNDDWPAFTGLRSRLPLSSANLRPSAPNTTTTVDWNVTDDTLHIKFKLDKGTLSYEPYMGVGLLVDVSHCEWGIGYTYKGSKHTLRPEQSNINDVVGGWDYHHNSRPTNTVTEWTAVRIPWSYFQQIGWGGHVEQDVSLITILNWYVGYMEGSSGDEGEIWVRDVWCLGDASGVSVRPSANKQSVNANPLVKISGRNLQLRLANDGKVEIYSINGKRLSSIKLKQGEHNIRMNNLSRGTYIVNVSAGTSAKQSLRMLIK